MRNASAGMLIPHNDNRQGMQMGYYYSYPQASASPNSMHDKPQSHCECVPQETSIECVRLAEAYVPFQKFCGTWSPVKSLLTGTAFPELFSPYRKREYVNLEPEVTCGMSPAGGGCY